MKNFLLKTGEPMANIGNLATSITSTTSTHNVDLNSKPENNNLDLKDIQEISNQNGDLLQTLVSLLNSKHSTYKKIEQTFSEQKFKEFMLSIFKVKVKDKQQVVDFEKSLDLNLRVMYQKFITLFKKESKNLKKSLANISLKQYNKQLSNEFKEKAKFVNSGVRDYKVNIIKGEEDTNSKSLGIKVQNLENKISQLESLKKTTIDNLERCYKTAKALSATLVAISAASIVTTIFSFFFPVAFVGSIALGASSVTISIIKSNTDKEINKYQNYLNFYDDILEKIKKDTFKNGGLVSVWNYFSALVLQFSTTIKAAGLEYNAATIAKFNNWAQATAVSKITGFFAIGLSAIDLGLNSYELNDLMRKNDLIEQFNNSFLENINDFKGELNKIKSGSTKWVVINETKQTDFYHNGGTGGKNLAFKNIKTGEIFQLQELLNKSKSELWIWGLTKVFDKEKGWYIRTLPNNTKKDNLG